MRSRAGCSRSAAMRVPWNLPTCEPSTSASQRRRSRVMIGMSETAAARLRRILLLIPHLADGNDHAVADLARALGIDRDTLVRDIETLVTRADDPGGFV